MSTKIRLRVGIVECEYEGDAAYSIEEVKDLFSHIESLIAAASVSASSGAPSVTSEGDDNGEMPSAGDAKGWAVNTIAARLEVKTASDLAIAAAAHLQLSLGKESFTRKELLTSMQSAKNYYNVTMRSNLSSTLKTLVSGKRINALSNDQMSLSAVEQNALREKIAK